MGFEMGWCRGARVRDRGGRRDRADLSGELPLLADVIARFHAPAAAVRVAVVQMAGWEALPADLTTLLASRRATGAAGEGSGAAGPVTEVAVSAAFQRVPAGRLSLSQALSAGTMATIVQILADGRAWMLAAPARCYRPAWPPRISCGCVLAGAEGEGRGHPGYAATAAMIAEVGLRLAVGRTPRRAGCLTPAMVMGSLDLDPWFVEGLRLG